MRCPVTVFAYSTIAILVSSTQCEECNRVPLGIKTTPLPPDDRYSIRIQNIGKNYLPGQTYKVFLESKDSYNATFIAFTISASGEEKETKDNKRKPLKAGLLRISPDENNAMEPMDGCNNTIIQNHIMPKTSVQVTWEAPPKGNGCVTIHAYVAIKSEVYYNNQGPLAKQVCEDLRKPEDMQPKVNTNCTVCQDAKYKMTFVGLWSSNTHQGLVPTLNTTPAAFSEIVGASHNNDYTIFKSNDEASEGVKMLAEQGNTTRLEMDMQEKIGNSIGPSIRSIIKANRPKTTTSTITAMFRVTKKHHLVSMVTAILPSPDWFLGASHMELCVADENQWAKNITLNLYPMDAGTDKGTDFNSANDNMMPPMPIGRASFSHIAKGDIKPFARIEFNLINIYHLTPGCFNRHDDGEGGGSENEGEGGSEEGGSDGGDVSDPEGPEEKPETTTSTTETPMVTDPNSTSECPMTAWGEWTPCQGICEGGKLNGAHSRTRYHILNGEPFKYFEQDSNDAIDGEVPEECVEENNDQEIDVCEEDCEEATEAPVQSEQQIAPGNSWRDWFSF